MKGSLAEKWTILDAFIQHLRYRKVIPFIPRDSILVDLGCGDGNFLWHVRHRIRTGHGIDNGVDGPKEIENISILPGNVNEKMPVEDDFSDVVTAIALLEHLTEPGVFIGEIYRILKPGGLCVMTTPSPAGRPILEFLAFRLGVISVKYIEDHKHYFPEHELRDLLKMFSQVKISYFQLGWNTFITARKPPLS
ncbi:MAG: class I SAM-dependent methyltransferase [Vulcanimicrobiota bacterium]